MRHHKGAEPKLQREKHAVNHGMAIPSSENPRKPVTQTTNKNKKLEPKWLHIFVIVITIVLDMCKHVDYTVRVYTHAHNH